MFRIISEKGRVARIWERMRNDFPKSNVVITHLHTLDTNCTGEIAVAFVMSNAAVSIGEAVLYAPLNDYSHSCTYPESYIRVGIEE